MIVVILILTIFNTGLLIINLGGIAETWNRIRQSEERIKIDNAETFAEMGTMIYNMDSLKQKVRMSGKAEL